MKKILLIATFFVVAFTTAKADNPHFVCSQTSVVDNLDGSATVNFKLVGLGNTVSTTVSISGNASYTIKCWNSQGHLVPGQSGRREVVIANQNFTSDANGQITNSFNLEVGSGSCRPNFHARFKVEVSDINWSNVTLSANSDGTIISSTNCFD